jgi:hypothetical protein
MQRRVAACDLGTALELVASRLKVWSELQAVQSRPKGQVYF